MYDPKVHVGVAARLVRIHEGREQVLLLKRAATATHGASTWGLPGGWIDWGQEPSEAAAREVLEELNVRVDLTSADLVGAVANTYEEQDMHIVCLGIAFSGFDESTLENREPQKHDEVAWVDVEALASLPLFPPLASLAREWGWL